MKIEGNFLNSEKNIYKKLMVRFLCWANHLEKEMESHSSIPARKIPWTEEPGGLQSMESQDMT